MATNRPISRVLRSTAIINAIAIENDATKMMKMMINEITRFSCSITNRNSRFESIQLIARNPGRSTRPSRSLANWSALAPGRNFSFKPCTPSSRPYNSCITRSVEIIILPSNCGEPVRNKPTTVNSLGNNTSSCFKRSNINGVNTSTTDPGPAFKVRASPSPRNTPSSSNSSRLPNVRNFCSGITPNSAIGSMPRIIGNCGRLPCCSITTPSANGATPIT